MSDDPLDYQVLLQDALRGLVRRSLEIVAEHGFSGDHHFYISYRTRAQGVVIPEHMLDSYPDEMTIVLKTQYQDLTVTDEEFSVGLFFGGVLYYLTIPFDAVLGFADPSAEFHLGFQPMEDEEAPEAEDEAPAAEEGESPEVADNVVAFSARKPSS